MGIAAPAATIAPELFAEINALLNASAGYVNDNFQIRRLQADCQKLIATDAVNGHMALSGTYHLMGDTEKARYHSRCAENLQPSSPELAGGVAIWLGNMGFFADAYERYQKAVDPTTGFFSRFFDLGLVFGAFETMRKATLKAQGLKLDMTGLAVDVSQLAARILSQHGVDEAKAVAILDIAGEVLRENRLFFQNAAPDVDAAEIDGVDSCVYVTYRVMASPGKAAEMTAETAARIAQRISDIPTGFSVGFFGTVLQ